MPSLLGLGRSSRTLMAFLAALVLALPPGLAASLIRKSQQPAAQATAHRSCCSAKSGHEACSEPGAKEIRSACCQHSTKSGVPASGPMKSCCGGMGGCGCTCCPSAVLAVVPNAPFEWTSPVLAQAVVAHSLVFIGRQDVPPTPPPNFA